MYYIEISNNLITGKGEGQFRTDEQIEVSKDIYDALTNLPASYMEKDGEIISVDTVPAPEIHLAPKERREQEYESNPLISWQGQSITVDQANLVYLQYLAEDSTKATEIQTLIINAKESIRQAYPDEVE